MACTTPAPASRREDATARNPGLSGDGEREAESIIFVHESRRGCWRQPAHLSALRFAGISRRIMTADLLLVQRLVPRPPARWRDESPHDYLWHVWRAPLGSRLWYALESAFAASRPVSWPSH